MKPKDQDPKDKKRGVIYSYQCGDTACVEEYIGETSRTLGERQKEHLKQPSPIQVHIQQTGHTSTNHNSNITGREGQGLVQILMLLKHISQKQISLYSIYTVPVSVDANTYLGNSHKYILVNVQDTYITMPLDSHVYSRQDQVT